MNYEGEGEAVHCSKCNTRQYGHDMIWADNEPYCSACNAHVPRKLTVDERIEKLRRTHAQLREDEKREWDFETKAEPTEKSTLSSDPPLISYEFVFVDGSGNPLKPVDPVSIDANGEAVKVGKAVSHVDFTWKPLDAEVPQPCPITIDPSHVIPMKDPATPTEKLEVGDYVEVDVFGACRITAIPPYPYYAVDQGIFEILGGKLKGDEGTILHNSPPKLTSNDGFYEKTGKVVRGAFEGAPEWAKWKVQGSANNALFVQCEPEFDEDEVKGDAWRIVYSNKAEKTDEYHDGSWRESLVRRCVKDAEREE